MEMEMACSDHQNKYEFAALDEEFVVDDLLDLGGLADTEETDISVGCDHGIDDVDTTNSSYSSVSFDVSPVSELVLPAAHDVAELEWVSQMIDDSLSEFPLCSAVAVPPAKAPPAEAKAKAKRSKRSRGCWYSWAPPDSSSSSSTTTTCSSCSSNSYSSPPLACSAPPPPPAKKQSMPKKRGRKPKLPVPPSPTEVGEGGEVVGAAKEMTGGERRCSHCGVSKTPQWRAGPHGAKTLCNACGVRYKSGRLLPEYRPACSPTFVSHIHSNSHRKVLEMRRKKESDSSGGDNRALIFGYSATAVESF